LAEFLAPANDEMDGLFFFVLISGRRISCPSFSLNLRQKVELERRHPSPWNSSPPLGLDRATIIRIDITSPYSNHLSAARPAHDERPRPMERTKPRPLCSASCHQAQEVLTASTYVMSMPTLTRGRCHAPRRLNPASFSTMELQVLASLFLSPYVFPSLFRWLEPVALRPLLSHLAQTSAPGWLDPFFRCRLEGKQKQETRLAGRLCVPACQRIAQTSPVM
jgi:hypothetical protein